MILLLVSDKPSPPTTLWRQAWPYYLETVSQTVLLDAPPFHAETMQLAKVDLLPPSDRTRLFVYSYQSPSIDYTIPPQAVKQAKNGLVNLFR